MLLLAVPGCCCRYPSAENNKAANMVDSEARSQSSVKNKRVARDFSAEEVIKLVEDEEFSVWCDKNLSDDFLDEGDDEGDESQRGGEQVVDIYFTAYSQHPTVLNKLRTIISGKRVHFPFGIVWVLYTFFLQ